MTENKADPLRKTLIDRFTKWVEQYALKICPPGCLPLPAQEREISLFAEIVRALAAPQPAAPLGGREKEIVRLIDVLRADEGDSVTILCDNPDFNGQPNCAIVCNGDWTGWVDRRFAADTVLDALSMAVTEKNLPVPRKVVGTSNGHHWIERFNLVYCRDCGFVRRADDKNAQCKGPVGVGVRRDLLAAIPQERGVDRTAIERLQDNVRRIDQCLADLNWRPSRAHLEGARNTMQGALAALAGKETDQ